MKIKIGLYLAGLAFVLTFIVTRGKIIEGSVVFRRMIVNTIVFFVIGVGVEFFYNKYFLKMTETSEEDEAEAEENFDAAASPEEQKGSALDITVGEDSTPEIAPSSEEDTSPEPYIESSAPSAETVAPQPPPPKHTSVASNGKAKVEGDFIVYDDKKIPNDPKLIAQAIKTKLSGEE